VGSLKCEFGSEFTGKMLDRWTYERGVRIDFSRPGTPTDNATVESFNGRLRQKCLNDSGFMSLEDALRICRLPEYAARMKPVIPEYGWITYGERVNKFHISS
jgi:putative transposase